MIVILLLAVLGVGLALWGDKDDHAAAFVTGFFLVIAACICLLAMTLNRVGVGAELAQVAVDRSMTTTVDPQSAHDIYGEALRTNDIIASNQWFRHQWWSRDFVSAQWDTVTLIHIPEAKR